MSVFGLIPTFALGTFHVCLWFGAMAIYLGYIEEVEVPDESESSDEILDTKKNEDKPPKGRKILTY